MRRLVIGVTVLACSASIASAQAGKDAGIDKVRTSYEKAAMAGDVAGLVALYTDDATVMPPDMPAVKGKANVEAFHKQMQDSTKVSNLKIIASDTRVAGDTAVDVGTYSQTLTPKGGQPMNDTGKYVVVMKKQGDAWKLAYEIFNSDKPMAMPPPAMATPTKK